MIGNNQDSEIRIIFPKILRNLVLKYDKYAAKCNDALKLE